MINKYVRSKIQKQNRPNDTALSACPVTISIKSTRMNMAKVINAFINVI